MASLTIRIPRMRRPRRREPVDLRSRLRRFLVWAADVSATLEDTGTAQTFAADAASDEIDIVDHGWIDGDGPFVVTTDTTLPAGLSADQIYWVSAPTAGTLQLHLTFAEAVLGINPVAITSAGTGIHSLVPATTDEAIVEYLRRGVTPVRINAETDIDNLI